MINTFWKVFQVLCCLCNKEDILSTSGCFGKKKKKGSGGVEDQNGLLPIFGSLSRQRILFREKECWSYVVTVVLGRDRVLRPGARPYLDEHNERACS